MKTMAALLLVAMTCLGRAARADGPPICEHAINHDRAVAERDATVRALAIVSAPIDATTDLELRSRAVDDARAAIAALHCLIPLQEDIDRVQARIGTATDRSEAVTASDLSDQLVDDRSTLVPFVKTTVEKIAAAEHAIKQERACRTSPTCSESRSDRAAAVQVCAVAQAVQYWSEIRASAKERIALERSNPSGVVDLVSMHQAGQDIQTAEHELRQIRPALDAARSTFQRARRKIFNETMCSAGS